MIKTQNIRLVQAGALFAVTALFFLFDAAPKISRMRDLNTQIRAQSPSRQDQSPQAKAQRLSQLKDEWQQMTRDLAFLKAAVDGLGEKLTRQQDAALVIMEIEDMASGEGLELQSVSPAPVTQAQTHWIQPLDLVLQCDLVKIIHFLSRLEKGTALMGLQKLSMTQKDPQAEVREVRLTVVALSALGPEASSPDSAPAGNGENE